MTFLVGRNGAGKSNFLDAMAFVADGLETSIDHAIKSRGGMESVRRRSKGHPPNFSIRLTFNLPELWTGEYAFEVSARKKGGFAVRSEELKLIRGAAKKYFKVREGAVMDSSESTLPKGVSDRLYLVAASGLEVFRPAYDALRSTGFYSLNPEAMKELQSPDAGELLHRDGGNIASVISRIENEAPNLKDRVEQYLEKIVSEIVGVKRIPVGPKETIEFRQNVKGDEHPWRFYANSMSDGTLRALGILVAVSQFTQPASRIRLAGIEEPETALHPAAAGALIDALREAANSTQIIVTTHSADLLDHIGLDDADQILSVVAREGRTLISRIDAASREALNKHLYSAGELLRLDQIEPDRFDLERQGALFASGR